MGLHLCDADEQRQRELFERVCAFIDCAAQLNARVTIGSIKGNIRRVRIEKSIWTYWERRSSALTDYAGQKM